MTAKQKRETKDRKKKKILYVYYYIYRVKHAKENAISAKIYVRQNEIAKYGLKAVKQRNRIKRRRKRSTRKKRRRKKKQEMKYSRFITTHQTNIYIFIG